MKEGRASVSGVTVLDASHLIPFKAKAWLDLTSRKEKGEHIDERDIRKHKNDVFRLTELLSLDLGMPDSLPEAIKKDMRAFLDAMEREGVDVDQLGIRGKTKEDIVDELRSMYL